MLHHLFVSNSSHARRQRFDMDIGLIPHAVAVDDNRVGIVVTTLDSRPGQTPLIQVVWNDRRAFRNDFGMTL